MNIDEELRITKELKYFYDASAIPSGYRQEKQKQITALPKTNEAGENMSVMEAVLSSTTLPDVEKASFIIYLLIENPSSAFYSTKNGETNLFKAAQACGFDQKWPKKFDFDCILSLMGSKNDDVAAQKMRLLLSDPSDPMYARFRDDFVTWYFLEADTIAKKPGEKFVKNDKDFTFMNAILSILLSPDYLHLGISYLAELSHHPIRLGAFAQWMVDLGHSPNEFTMTKDLDIYSDGSYANKIPDDDRIRAAQRSLRILFWSLVEEEYQRTYDVSVRHDAIGSFWENLSVDFDKHIDHFFEEMDYAVSVNISLEAITAALCETYASDLSVPLKSLLALQNATSLSIHEYLLSTAWDDKDPYHRIEAVLAMGTPIADILSMDNVRTSTSVKVKKLLQLPAPDESVQEELEYLFDCPRVGDSYWGKCSKFLESINAYTVESILGNEALTQFEKSKAIILSVLVQQNILFFEKDGVSVNVFQEAKSRGIYNDFPTEFWHLCMLRLFVSRNDEIRSDLLAWLNSDCSQFIEWCFTPVALELTNHLDGPDAEDMRLSKFFWECIISKHEAVSVKVLSKIYQNKSNVQALVAQWRNKLGFDMDSVKTPLSLKIMISQQPAELVRDAIIAVRAIYWVTSLVVAPYQSFKEEIERLWALSTHYRLVEVSAALFAGVEANVLANVLCSYYMDHPELKPKDLVTFFKATQLPFYQYFIKTMWLKDHDHKRQLEAALAIDVPLNRTLNHVNIPDMFSDDVSRFLVGYLEQYPIDLHSMVIQRRILVRINEHSFPECAKKLKLASNEKFIKICRDNIVSMFSVVMMHPSLIKFIFKDGIELEKELIKIRREDFVLLIRQPHYPLKQLIKSYVLFDAAMKEGLFIKKSDFYNAMLDKLNDDYFLTLAKEKDSQEALLKMCAENDMFRDLYAHQKGSNMKFEKMAKAGLKEGIFDPEILIDIFAKNKVIVDYCKEILNPPQEQAVENVIETVDEKPNGALNNNGSSSSSMNVTATEQKQKQKQKQNKASIVRPVPVIPPMTSVVLFAARNTVASISPIQGTPQPGRLNPPVPPVTFAVPTTGLVPQAHSSTETLQTNEFVMSPLEKRLHETMTKWKPLTPFTFKLNNRG